MQRKRSLARCTDSNVERNSFQFVREIFLCSSEFPEAYLMFHFVLFCFVELQPTFTAEPPQPFTVLEGNNITLEWSYDLGGGSFRRIELREITSSPTILILEVDAKGQIAFLDNDYTGRLQVNVTATQSSIKILGAKRTDSKDYTFDIFQLGSPTTTSRVTILVQCKYKSRSV